MEYTLAITLVIVIVLIWIVYNNRMTPQSTSDSESLINIVYKQAPQNQAATCDAVKIDAIPLREQVGPQSGPVQPEWVEPYYAEDPTSRPVYTDEKPHISLTFDAAVARRALMSSRDKRMYDAIANRTTDYWRPFFEEEIRQCESRDWWDDVAYPMNDSGEFYLRPEKDLPEIPFARSI